MSKPDDSDKAENGGPSAIEQYLVKDPERFALNMARMVEQAGKAASAWAEPREKGEVRDHVAEPVVDMVKTFSKLSEYWNYSHAGLSGKCAWSTTIQCQMFRTKFLG